MASDHESRNAITVFGKLDAPHAGEQAEPLTIDLTAIATRIDSPEAGTASAGGSAAPSPSGGRAWRDRAGALAASLVAAVLVGAFAGGVATFEIVRHALPADPGAALTDETQALQEKVARLTAELATFKTGVEAANRTASQQLNRIGERLDRAEKAQAEPAARIARIADSIDRLERRVAATAPEVTGSVTAVEKQAAKPAEVEGWKLRDYHAGRALLESRGGTLFDVGPGSNVPGIGKIETIRRVDGRIVVTTPKGVITSSLEAPRRRPFYMPY